MGWIAASAAVGGLLCMPLAGLIGNFGWRYVFFLYLISLPILLLAMFGIERAPAPVWTAKPAARLRLPPRSWQFVPLAISIGAVVNATPMFLPFHLAESGIDRPSMISIAMLCTATAGVISSVLYGTIRRWLSMPHIFVMTFTVSAAGLALVSHAQSYEVMLLALALSGLGLGLAMPNLYAIAAAIGAPTQIGKVIGLAIGCFFMGGPLLQAVLEFAVGRGPAWVPLTIIAALSLVLALIWLAMTPVFREDRAAPTVA